MEALFHDLVSNRQTGLASSLARSLLSGLELPYRAVVGLRNRCFDVGFLKTAHFETPIISVGNITLGGTGKTPFVEFIADRYATQGLKVIVLSRGYGVTEGANDEALLLRSNLPEVDHYQGKNRVELAHRALSELQPDLILLDDGFQHRRIARTLDIVLVDCTNPFGYNRVFPRGMLREPIEGLRRADCIALTRSQSCTEQERLQIRNRIISVAGPKHFVECEHNPVSLWTHDGGNEPLEQIRGKRVAAFCGIGNPKGFWKTLETAGAKIVARRSFSDHHPYQDSDHKKLAEWVWASRPDLVVTTQKDLVKLRMSSIAYRPLKAVRIAMELGRGSDTFLSVLDRSVGEIESPRVRIAA